MPRPNQFAISVYTEPQERKFLRLAACRRGVNLSWFILSAALVEAERVTGMKLNRFMEELEAQEAGQAR